MVSWPGAVSVFGFPYDAWPFPYEEGNNPTSSSPSLVRGHSGPS